jgi:hypothetical protein
MAGTIIPSRFTIAGNGLAHNQSFHARVTASDMLNQAKAAAAAKNAALGDYLTFKDVLVSGAAGSGAGAPPAPHVAMALVGPPRLLYSVPAAPVPSSALDLFTEPDVSPDTEFDLLQQAVRLAHDMGNAEELKHALRNMTAWIERTAPGQPGELLSQFPSRFVDQTPHHLISRPAPSQFPSFPPDRHVGRLLPTPLVFRSDGPSASEIEVVPSLFRKQPGMNITRSNLVQDTAFLVAKVNMLVYQCKKGDAVMGEFLQCFSEVPETLTWASARILPPMFEIPCRKQPDGFWQDFCAGFVSYFSGEVRNPGSVALWDITSGRVTQGSDPSATYAERFMTCARLLPNESQSSLCVHFLRGLRPDLRPLCCLDRDNREWVSLHDLVRFTASEEIRLSVRSNPDLGSPLVAKPYKRQEASRLAEVAHAR